MHTLSDLRADFDRLSKRSFSLPTAGLITWAVIAWLGLALSFEQSVFALVFATGAIFPIAMLIARLRGEQLMSHQNPLARLMGVCVIMVNLLWAVHIPLLMRAPEFVPLSLGTALGLHWMVYSWIIGHPLGYVHALLRTGGLLAAWYFVPAYPVTATAMVVVTAYAVTLFQMAHREPYLAPARR